MSSRQAPESMFSISSNTALTLRTRRVYILPTESELSEEPHPEAIGITLPATPRVGPHAHVPMS